MFAFLQATWDVLLDTLFPLSTRTLRVRAYTPETLKVTPMQHAACGIKIITLATYRDPTIKDAITALKYEQSVPSARLLAAMLDDYLLDLTSDEDAFSEHTLVLVPMPLAPQREKDRGYNQIKWVLNALAVNIPIRTDLLLRTRETPPQTKLPRKERLTNVTGAFATPVNTSLSNLHIILIDDVVTTGATLAAATRALEESGARVSALAFAHA